MTRKTDKGRYVPKHPEKYIGNNIDNVTYRSSWELSVMLMFDGGHPNILAWASEPFSIPYQNPLTMKWTMYVPDFIVIYLDKDNRRHCEVLEIKPQRETPGFKGKRLTEAQKLSQAINAAKWQAAAQFCAKRGWNFRVLTEQDLFKYDRK